MEKYVAVLLLLGVLYLLWKYGVPSLWGWVLPILGLVVLAGLAYFAWPYLTGGSLGAILPTGRWVLIVLAVIGILLLLGGLIALSYRMGWTSLGPTMTAEQWALLTAPLIVLVTIFLLIPALFPEFAAKYVSADGPVVLLILMLVLLALAALIPWGWVRVPAIVGLGAILFFSTIGPVWSALPWPAASPPAPVRYVVVSPRAPDPYAGCDGRWHTFRLDSSGWTDLKNPNDGICKAEISLPDGGPPCIEIKQAVTAKALGPFCRDPKKTVVLPKRIAEAKTVSGSMEVSVRMQRPD